MKKLGNNDLIYLLGLDKYGQSVADSVKTIRETIKIHQEHMLLSKSGVLFLLASCVFDLIYDSISIFDRQFDIDHYQ